MSLTAHERSRARHADAVAQLRTLFEVARATPAIDGVTCNDFIDVHRADMLLSIIMKAADECEETLTEYVDSYNTECSKNRRGK